MLLRCLSQYCLVVSGKPYASSGLLSSSSREIQELESLRFACNRDMQKLLFIILFYDTLHRYVQSKYLCRVSNLKVSLFLSYLFYLVMGEGEGGSEFCWWCWHSKILSIPKIYQDLLACCCNHCCVFLGRWASC